MEKREQIDIENPEVLRRYLRNRPEAAAADGFVVTALPGGVSCRTVKVRFATGEGWVLKQALEKLRVPVDWFADPSRAHREAMAIEVLARICPPGSVPRLVFEDEANHLIAMEAVADPHENWKSMLLQGRLEDDHVRQFAAILAAVHGEGWRGRETLQPRFADRSFFRALRLEPYYSYSGQQVPAAAPFLEDLVRQTEERVITLVHGDYSPKNILVRSGKLVLLDHEVIHFGDPAFDLGFSLTHLLAKAHHLRHKRERFAAAARLYWTTYREKIAAMPWAGGLEPWAARHALGCLLARAAGRSQLEYLDAAERLRQREAVVSLMAAPPATVAELADAFLARVAERERGS